MQQPAGGRLQEDYRDSKYSEMKEYFWDKEMAKGGIFMFNHRPLFQASSCREANYHFHIKAQVVESHT